MKFEFGLGTNKFPWLLLDISFICFTSL